MFSLNVLPEVLQQFRHSFLRGLISRQIEWFRAMRTNIMQWVWTVWATDDEFGFSIHGCLFLCRSRHFLHAEAPRVSDPLCVIPALRAAGRAIEAAVGRVDGILNVSHSVTNFGPQEKTAAPRENQARDRAN